MKLTEKDKNAMLKAALMAEDLESLKRWVGNLVDAVDKAELAEGKSDVSVQVPPYMPSATAKGNGRSPHSYLEPSLL